MKTPKKRNPRGRVVPAPRGPLRAPRARRAATGVARRSITAELPIAVYFYLES
jgi:hypothetical protein